MTDRPIIFSGPMIRALLDGRKTMTRRVLKPQPVQDGDMWRLDDIIWFENSFHVSDGQNIARKIRYAPGARLWVRETCGLWMMRDGKLIRPPDGDGVVYRATEPEKNWAAMLADQKTLRDMNCGRSSRTGNWAVRSCIHMPRWASRLTLIVESVKVERLQEISASDCFREGSPRPDMARCWGSEVTIRDNARIAFRKIWEGINGPDSWSANPWVAAIGFHVVKANIDSEEARAA
jgi:hypothetical protein